MAWYPDLDRCEYFRLADASRLRAVGWLEREHEFAHGRVDVETLSILFELARDPWQPVLYLGSHTCSLCDDRHGSEGPEEAWLDGRRVDVGMSNLFIPEREVVFVAPSMILHYVIDHEYQPPERFLVAVRACPPMGSSEYLAGIRDAGGSEFERARLTKRR